MTSLCDANRAQLGRQPRPQAALVHLSANETAGRGGSPRDPEPAVKAPVTLADMVNVSHGYGHASLIFTFQILVAGVPAERGVVLRAEPSGTIPTVSATPVAGSRPDLRDRRRIVADGHRTTLRVTFQCAGHPSKFDTARVAGRTRFGERLDLRLAMDGHSKWVARDSNPEPAD
jgi:hypothetical protein